MTFPVGLLIDQNSPESNKTGINDSHSCITASWLQWKRMVTRGQENFRPLIFYTFFLLFSGVSYLITYFFGFPDLALYLIYQTVKTKRAS